MPHRRTASKRLVTDGRILGEIDQLRDTLRMAKIAERSNSQGLADEVPRLERQLEELALRAAEESILITVEALAGEVFDDLVRRHPPTAAQLDRYREQAKATPWIQMPEMDPQSMGPELLSACLIAPDWTAGETEKFWRERSKGEQNQLWNLALSVQIDGADLPFSPAATGMIDGGGDRSIMPASEESPSPSS